MPNKYQKAIDELVENFDFEKVQAYMALTGWTYCGAGKTTPTIEDLKKTARYALSELANNHDRWVATGGFRADLYKDKDSVELSLSFVAVEDTVYV